MDWRLRTQPTAERVARLDWTAAADGNDVIIAATPGFAAVLNWVRVWAARPAGFLLTYGPGNTRFGPTIATSWESLGAEHVWSAYGPCIYDDVKVTCSYPGTREVEIGYSLVAQLVVGDVISCCGNG